MKLCPVQMVKLINFDKRVLRKIIILDLITSRLKVFKLMMTGETGEACETWWKKVAIVG